jgi:acetone carboxylase gamma subunit
MECQNEQCNEENGTVTLTEVDVDDRQEWIRTTYKCPKCGTLHERLTTFQPQSRLVASDEFHIEDGRKKWQRNKKR